MMTKTLAALALAGGIALMSAPVQAAPAPLGVAPVDAGIQLVHHKKFKRGWRKHRRFNRHWHGYRGCGYFYRKARWTGSKHWWKKYRRCVAHQYYFYY